MIENWGYIGQLPLSQRALTQGWTIAPGGLTLIAPQPQQTTVVVAATTPVATAPVPPHLQFSANTIGKSIPIIYGTVRTAGDIVWAAGIDATSNTLDTSYLTFRASYGEPADLSEPVRVQRMWANGTLFYDYTDGGVITVANLTAAEQLALSNTVTNMEVYYGGFDQTASPTEELYLGTGNAPAYRGLRSIVFKDFPLAVAGNSVPNISVEWQRTDTTLVDLSDAILALIDRYLYRIGYVNSALYGTSSNWTQYLRFSVSGVDDQCYGMVATDRSSPLSILQNHAQIYRYRLTDSGTDVKIVRRAVDGSLSIDLSLDESDCLRENGSAALRYDRVEPKTVPEGIDLNYLDPVNYYDGRVQQARHEGTQTSAVVSSVSTIFIVDATTARRLAYDALYDIRSRSLQITYSVDDPSIEPSDIHQITTSDGDVYTCLVEEQTYTKSRASRIRASALLTSVGVAVDGASSIDTDSIGVGGTLDGHTSGGFSGTSGAVTLTTAYPNDVIVVCVHSGAVGAYATVSTVSSASLTWTRRTQQQWIAPSPDLYENMEVWWAKSTSPLSEEVITITLASSADAATIVAFGIHGAYDIDNPWDTSLTVPAFDSTTASDTLTVTGISTTATPVMLEFQATGNGSAPPGASSGFTSFETVSEPNSPHSSNARLAYRRYTSSLASASFSNGSAATNIGMIVDAIATTVAITDPYWTSVVLLMGFEDTNGSHTAPGFTDESYPGHGTATQGGSAAVSTSQYVFGSSSLYCDGSSSYIAFSDSVDWGLGTGAFTIEMRVRFAATPTNALLIAHWHGGWAFYFESGQLKLRSNSGNDTTTYTWSPTLNTWYTIAVDRDGSNVARIYVDGVMVSKTTGYNYNLTNNNGSSLTIGHLIGFGYDVNGYFDEVRITKGVGRYISDSGYTPAIARFPRG